MKGVRLSVAVADAVPHAEAPEAAAEASPAAEPASHAVEGVRAPTPPPQQASSAPAVPSTAPSSPVPSRGGGWLSRMLRRPAEYARAYLTASLEHQFELQAMRTHEIAFRVQRLEALEGRSQATLEEVRSLALRLDELERRLGRSLGGQDAIAAMLEQQAAAARDHLNLAHDQLSATRRQAAGLDELTGIVGPRFDELEIKLRPLVPFDEESWAVRIAEGYVLLPRSEPVFATSIMNASSGGLEPGTRRVLKALLRPGDLAADVGANVGLLTFAMAASVGAGGRVWAFEPEARVRAQLAKTLHLNGLRQVTLSGAAVGAEAGRLTFNQSPIIGHSSLYVLPGDEQAAARPVEVEVVRLDDVVPQGSTLAAVKIDVEGAELDVLRGMARVIADSPDLAVVAEFGPSHLERVGITPADWFAAFAAHGLQAHLIEEPTGAASPTSPHRLAGVESANLVFVRPGSAAASRLPR